MEDCCAGSQVWSRFACCGAQAWKACGPLGHVGSNPTPGATYDVSVGVCQSILGGSGEVVGVMCVL